MFTKDAVLINKKIFEVDGLTKNCYLLYILLCESKFEKDDKFEVKDGIIVNSSLPNNSILMLTTLQSLGLVEYVGGCWRPIINYGDCVIFNKKGFFEKTNESPLHLLMHSLERWNCAYDEEFNVVYNQDPTLNKKIVEKFFGNDRDTIKANFDRARELCGMKDISYSCRINKTIVVKLKDRLVKGKDINKEFQGNLIGELFELAYGKHLERQGHEVIYRGINLGREDGGIDLVSHTNYRMVKYTQCKYWSKDKKIDEDVIIKTYESTVALIMEINERRTEEEVKKIVTNNNMARVVSHTTFTKKAKSTAKKLGVEIIENIDIRKLF